MKTRCVNLLLLINQSMDRSVKGKGPEGYTYTAAYLQIQLHQSAYRKKHSTETAMLRVWSDVLTSADVREVTLLDLLDLSDTISCCMD